MGQILRAAAREYDCPPSERLTAPRSDGKLLLQSGRQPPLPLLLESDAEFFAGALNAEVTFTRDEQGRIISLMLHPNGQNRTAS